MTYDFVASFSQTAALIFFIVMFCAVMAYAFWPGNRDRFDKAQRDALDLSTHERRSGGSK